ncbi:hypothetical protein SSX86_032567 [Deinandra increscens subsp. villosa]|uniref:Beta-galactosidase galactose-binding domain-containing protein n=1 Tax=Deinandra increscens subsp. villosa TaxID=3103831 RepID=A0AAP0C4S8_9ASTR
MLSSPPGKKTLFLLSFHHFSSPYRLAHLQRTKLCDLEYGEVDESYVTKREQLKEVVKSVIHPKIVQGKSLNGNEFVASLEKILCGVVGGHYETWESGVLGPVALYGLDQGKRDLSWFNWTYQVGLKGEAMNVFSLNTNSNIKWTQGSLITQKQQPVTWHKAYFNEPHGDEPLALDMNSMGKGEAWINGEIIGRYWSTYANGDCQGCHYDMYS